jgi:hypothetical protein
MNGRAKKDEIGKMLDEMVKSLEKGDPKATEAVKKGAALAGKKAKELFQAEENEIRAALKKAAGSRPLDLSQIAFMMRRLSEGCSGSDCAIACAAGCAGACFFAPPLIGFGAAGGTIGGAGTNKILTNRVILI